jgi:hypothetical protein
VCCKARRDALHCCAAHQRKNCEPLVFGPAFAIDSVPAAVCLAMGHKVIVLQAALLYMCGYPQYENP